MPASNSFQMYAFFVGVVFAWYISHWTIIISPRFDSDIFSINVYYCCWSISFDQNNQIKIDKTNNALKMKKKNKKKKKIKTNLLFNWKTIEMKVSNGLLNSQYAINKIWNGKDVWIKICNDWQTRSFYSFISSIYKFNHIQHKAFFSVCIYLLPFSLYLSLHCLASSYYYFFIVDVKCIYITFSLALFLCIYFVLKFFWLGTT